MAKKQDSEKRKYARINISSKINFSIIETDEDEAPSKRFRATGKNIGVEGILCTSDKELKPGTLLDLEIFLPEKIDPVYLEGEVRWCKLSGGKTKKSKLYDLGIKFLSIDKTHVLSLIKYVCGSLAADDQEI